MIKNRIKAVKDEIEKAANAIVDAIDSMTKSEFDAKLQHSYDQSLNGEGRPFEAVFDELERGLV